MSSFTEVLSFESTDRFVGGSESIRTVKGEQYLVLTGARRIVRITKPFKYVDEASGFAWIIPHGFECDLGSIPWVAQNFVAVDAPWAQAFVLHDFLYDQLRKNKIPEFTRKDADLAMYAALGLPFQVSRNDKAQRAVCPSLMRSAIYNAVRAFGSL